MRQDRVAAPSSARILVVEDEVVIAMDIQMQLRELGHIPVGHATHGEQAVVLAGELLPYLVLMDIHLAGAMNGITAAQTIRERFGLTSVFLSAFSGPQSRASAEACQPAGYLAKPFSERDLGDVIASFLESGRPPPPPTQVA